MRHVYLALALPLIILSGDASAQSPASPQLPPGAVLGIPTTAPVASIAPPPPGSFTAGQKHRYTEVQTYMHFSVRSSRAISSSQEWATKPLATLR